MPIGYGSAAVNAQLVPIPVRQAFDPLTFGQAYTGPGMWPRQGVYNVPPVMPSGSLAEFHGTIGIRRDRIHGPDTGQRIRQPVPSNEVPADFRSGIPIRGNPDASAHPLQVRYLMAEEKQQSAPKQDAKSDTSQEDLSARVQHLEAALAASRAALPLSLIPEHGAGQAWK